MMDADLEMLGYSPNWVEYGCRTPEFLRAQVEWFHSGHDRSTEHYRYSAFKQLQQRAAFSDTELDQYLELATLDPDPAMGTAATVDLIHHPGLTETQIEAVVAHPRLQELPRLVKKWRLLRALRAPEVTAETLQRCFEEGDSGVHRALLALPEIPHDLLAALHQSGASKAVRNIAGVRLKQREQRAPKGQR